ncbi:hypothetical protein L227DRAFT_292615 [Lentinus tigrinus ALCF2SS1-6]|uniref:Uncharacterized protein n=1 Tax=Lentinus tigrinus ALCF2SS1-6 TaxID=1328759 RepID=A0A5C2RXK9_9APHY|nr:hypothetical protein L227DRAFT_292615 [Lentinus tigrinus ALCF2SS1-6]
MRNHELGNAHAGPNSPRPLFPLVSGTSPRLAIRTLEHTLYQKRQRRQATRRGVEYVPVLACAARKLALALASRSSRPERREKLHEVGEADVGSVIKEHEGNEAGHGRRGMHSRSRLPPLQRMLEVAPGRPDNKPHVAICVCLDAVCDRHEGQGGTVGMLEGISMHYFLIYDRLSSVSVSTRRAVRLVA